MNTPLATVAGIAALGLLTLTSCTDPRDVAAPMEDSPQWSCVDMGNRVCGPGNSNGVPAGCYDDGAVLWAVWPCAPWVPSDGYRHATYASGPNAYDAGSYVGGYN